MEESTVVNEVINYSGQLASILEQLTKLTKDLHNLYLLVIVVVGVCVFLLFKKN